MCKSLQEAMRAHFWKMRESLGIAIGEACGIRTMKCKLIYILKEYRNKLCCPPRFSHHGCGTLQTSVTCQCKSEHSLTLQRVMDRKVFQKELSRTALEMVAKGSIYVRVSHWGLMALFTTAQLRTSIHISESAVWLPCHLIETWCP